MFGPPCTNNHFCNSPLYEVSEALEKKSVKWYKAGIKQKYVKVSLKPYLLSHSGTSAGKPFQMTSAVLHMEIHVWPGTTLAAVRLWGAAGYAALKPAKCQSYIYLVYVSCTKITSKRVVCAYNIKIYERSSYYQHSFCTLDNQFLSLRHTATGALLPKA